MKRKKFNKVIIWGYPLHSHTHSYIHGAWYKTFKSLGYDTYWFHNNDYPSDFDYSNSLFITEGYADQNIPLNKSSIYFVHICINPEKYKNVEARVIDIRFNVNEINDVNYSYVMNKNSLTKIDYCAYYEKDASDNALADSFKKGTNKYEALYLSWATDLLPSEINYDDMYKERENNIYWFGTIGTSNNNEIIKFISSLQKHNIGFIHHNPWTAPSSWDDVKQYTQKSFIAPDIRGGYNLPPINGKINTGPNHKHIGYIPCRIFKNISYGQLGITNSKAVYELFDKNLIYCEDESRLIDLAVPHIKNYKMIKEQMSCVLNNHTYVNRVNSLLKIL